MMSCLLLFLVLSDIPTVHCGFCFAAALNCSQDIFVNGKQAHWKIRDNKYVQDVFKAEDARSRAKKNTTLFSSFLCQSSSCRAWVKIQVFLLPLNLIKPGDSLTSRLQLGMPSHRHPAGEPNSHIFSIRPSLFHKSSHRSSFVT